MYGLVSFGGGGASRGRFRSTQTTGCRGYLRSPPPLVNPFPARTKVSDRPLQVYFLLPRTMTRCTTLPARSAIDYRQIVRADKWSQLVHNIIEYIPSQWYPHGRRFRSYNTNSDVQTKIFEPVLI